MTQKKRVKAWSWMIRQLAGGSLFESKKVARNILSPSPYWWVDGDVIVVPYVDGTVEVNGPKGSFFRHPDGRVRIR